MRNRNSKEIFPENEARRAHHSWASQGQGAARPPRREGTGKLGNNSYFIYVGDPGAHAFSIQSEAADTLHMEVDAGESYYVKETLGMGVVLTARI